LCNFSNVVYVSYSRIKRGIKVTKPSIKHLMTGPEGNIEFCFLRFGGNTIHCSPRDKSLNDLLYSKANGSNRWKNNHVIDK